MRSIPKSKETLNSDQRKKEQLNVKIQISNPLVQS